MKRTWKVILTTIIVAIFMLAYSTIANAVNMSSYSNLTIGFDGNGRFTSNRGNADIFCVQNGTALNSGTVLTVKDYVHIDGNTSTYNGNSKTCIENGIMAWILAQNSGTQDSSDHIRSYYSNKQNAIYGFFRTWSSAIGLNLSSNGGGHSNNSWVNQGREYANTITNPPTASITDNTDTEQIKVTAVELDGTNYIQVGPFNWSYTGDLSDVQVLDQDENPISDVLYGKYVGTELNTYQDATEAISSEVGFYVLVRADAGIEEISKITGKVSCSYQVYTADVWTLYGGTYQNLITTTSGVKTETNSVDIDFEYHIPLIIDLSGYVWEDKAGGKNSEYDDVYHGETYTDGNEQYDGNDILVEGITVRLIDGSTGEVVKNINGEECIATTDSNGAYKFEDLFISGLGNYYVEFEYNGLKYTSVLPLVGTDNSINSKASEVVEQRKELNNAFAEITNAGEITNRSQGYSRDTNGEVTSTLTYTNDTENWKSTFESTTYETNLTANTKVTNYSLEEQFKNGNYIINDNGKPEIQYINLGIVEREQPQMAISNDINNVEVTVNGYSHTYNYAQRYQYVENTTAFNVGVKFGSEYTNTYSRAIYPSDVQYSASDAEDANKLRVYVTYAITVRNLSNHLQGAVTELANYYDKEYTIVDSWMGDDQNNKINWNDTSKYGQSYNDGQYIGAYTTDLAGTKIDAGSNLETVYIKFQVSDNAVLGLLNGNATLNNVAEIYSYSTYYGTEKEGCSVGDVYAGIDKESATGNAKPGDNSTYEADTDKAPSLILEATGVREIEGTVFEDATSNDLSSGSERLGDGLYNEGENTASGVKVELLTLEGTAVTIYPNAFVDGKCVPNTEGETAIKTTEANGYYIFQGVEPGEYLIKYTYENGTTKIFDTNGNEVNDVTVQDYKSTILKSSSIINAFNNGDTEWYKKEVEQRYSDARDDYSQREKIDDQMENIDNSTLDNPDLIKTMTAESPAFDMGVEYETVYTASTGQAYTYKVSNADFGIVERPRQSATLTKEVANIKLTLPNGQVLVDGDPRTGLNYVSYTDGIIYVTVDSELIYGSQIEIKYDLVLTNTSELDYREESYYYYGKVEDENNLVKISSATLIDYVDSELVIKASDENGGWTVIANATDLAKNGMKLTEDEINQLLMQYSTVVTADAIPEGTLIAPGESATARIVLEKLLATSDELSYDNNGEVVTISKTGGRNMTTTLGNYAKVLLENPEAQPQESDEAKAYTVTVIPPTGAGNTVTYIIVGITALIALGAGTYFVRKIVKL